MRLVEPEIYLLASTKVDNAEVERWLGNTYGGKDFVTNAQTEAEKLVEHAARRCYKSHVVGVNPNVERKRDDIKEFLRNILKSGHGSVMEHPSFTYAFENVSRVFTHELVRHRVGVAISQESLRYVRLEDLGFWIPPSVQGPEPTNKDRFEEQSIEWKKWKTRRIMTDAVENDEQVQKELADVWGFNDPENKMPFSEKKKLTSMFRRLAPIGLATGILWTGNVRILRSVFEQRGNFHAEEEIFYVFNKVISDMVKREPNLFQDWSFEEGKGWTPEFRKV